MCLQAIRLQISNGPRQLDFPSRRLKGYTPIHPVPVAPHAPLSFPSECGVAQRLHGIDPLAHHAPQALLRNVVRSSAFRFWPCQWLQMSPSPPATGPVPHLPRLLILHIMVSFGPSYGRPIDLTLCSPSAALASSPLSSRPLLPHPAPGPEQIALCVRPLSCTQACRRVA